MEGGIATYQDTRTDTVQDPDRQQRCFPIRRKVFVHADADGDPDRGDERERHAHDPGCPSTCEIEKSDSRAKGETFEELVEDDHDEKGGPSFAAAYKR